MHASADSTVRELGAMQLAVRGDLIFTPQSAGGETYYMVEDPTGSRYFRLGVHEYTFVSLLDGRTAVRDALTLLSTVLPNHRLTEHDAAAICKWLVDMDLAHTTESAQASRLAKSALVAEDRKAIARWNPLIFRVPLCRPDRAFNALAQWLGWLYGPLPMIGWCVLVAIGLYKIFGDWDRFAASSQGIFAPSNWLWMAGCWVVLKLVHETSHGVVCRRYGGSVREMGILFILLAPLAYVDVTSSWRFGSRWQRIHVAAAGMYAELLIAAIAAIVWSNTSDGWLNNLCYNVIIMAGITTLLFNANPLMKFDGYYILSDGIGIPNLYVNGQQYCRYWARKYLLGVPSSLPAWTRASAVVIRVYGFASLVWRLIICTCMTITAATLFHGAGIVLAALAIVLWLGLPAMKFIQYFIFGKPGERPRRLRFLAIAGPAAVAMVVVFGWVPWPGATQAPAIVEYSPYTVVRADGAGFVSEIRVESGQRVERGQLLVVLENRELQNELDDLKLEIGQSNIRCRQLKQQGELAAYQAELKNGEALVTQLGEKQVQVDHLAVHAPCDGQVIRRNLDSLVNTYLEVGDEILSLGDENRKELRISILQDDFDAFSQRTSKPIRVDLPGEVTFHAPLKRVIPRASVEPTHPALTAANGGPLAVKNADHASSEKNLRTYELLAPRFSAVAALSSHEARRYAAGRLGSVSYRTFDESIGEHLYNAFSRWIRRRIESGREAI